MTMEWRGEKFAEIMLEAGKKALRTGGEAILTASINNTPIDTGTLRRSGAVTMGELPADSGAIYGAARDGKKEHIKAFSGPLSEAPTVFVSYNTPYARRQHEEINWNHPRGGGAKYLENAFKQEAPNVKKYIALKVREAIRKGLGGGK